MGGWIENTGKQMPVNPGTYVYVRFNDGKESPEPKMAKEAGTCWVRSSWGPWVTHYKVFKEGRQ